ncbi:UNVERIFIED_CONTAM: putative aspartic proteinase GIP1 [Sesamum calycinum]|uniref:Aspartic proteinase GIP1 n=1 Tax=Sesamum calycinum TaxID=2727403 RepID=A0AAW2SFF4_9LAMI
MPRHSLGGTSGRRAHLCVGAAGLLLATDAGRCRDVCPHLFDLSAGQGRPSEESRFATTIAHPKETLESVSMDYISGLPKPQNTLRRKGTAHLFFKHVVKYWGLPKDIVSDRDSRFTGVFWTELFRLLGSTLSMSSSYHPQSDGQTERFNSMLEEYLRHFVRGTQKDWVKLLDVAQLCFNAQKSSSTNKSAFEIVTGQQPLLPHTLDSPQGVRSPLARSFSQEWKQNVEIARSCLEKAQKRMKKYADNNRRFVEFNAGDLVMVKVPDPRLSKSSRGRDPRLMQNVFHVSQLKKYSADKEDDARNQPSRPQLELKKTKEKVAEAILNHRVTSTAKRTHNEYLVKWKGCSSEENTWERPQGLSTACRSLPCFHAPRTSPSQLFNEIHISNPCAIYCFATAPCLKLLLLLHIVLLILSARCASVGRYSVVVLLSGGSSRLLRTASHTVPLPPHCGRRTNECSPPTSLAHFPKILNRVAGGSDGVAALGRYTHSLPAQLSKSFSSPQIFAVCLPSSSKDPGLVNGRSIPLNKTLLAVDGVGQGGFKISSSRPYSVLQTSIFQALTDAFEKEAGGLNLSLIQPPVKPFKVCYAVDEIQGWRGGPAVPTIDLVLQSEDVFCRIYGSNSMVRVRTKNKVETWCLGFLDGGDAPKTSIIIGGRQLEDNLLQFDLERGRLGFSSSLLVQSTNCSNFDVN